MTTHKAPKPSFKETIAVYLQPILLSIIGGMSTIILTFVMKGYEHLASIDDYISSQRTNDTLQNERIAEIKTSLSSYTLTNKDFEGRLRLIENDIKGILVLQENNREDKKRGK